MSKAFTKEDSGDDDDDQENPALQIPKGSKNYITPSGAEKLKAELKHLLTKERPDLVKVVSWAASNGDRSENGDYLYGKRRLRQIDSRIRFLGKRIESFEVVDPAHQRTRENSDRILFSATVTVVVVSDDDSEDGAQNDTKKTYQIVGIDETEPAVGKVSWISPIARALMNGKVGDVVMLRTPAGERELEIVRIEYK
jgi:transcription elongation factor GreB